MPRSIARIGRERTLPTLARNLFVLDDASPDDRRRVERALLAANPGLARRENFEAGNTVIVPGITGFSRSDRVETNKADLTGVLRDTAARLEIGTQELKQGTASVQKRLEKGSEQLKDRRFLRLVEKVLPDGGKALEQTLKGLETERKALDTRNSDLTAAFSEARNSLANLARAVKQGPERDD